MKLKLIALILALTVVSWAQTATPNPTSEPQQSTAPAEAKACPCCDKAASAESKDGQASCAHHAMMAAEGKEPACCARKDKASCCSGKDGMSCKREGKDKTAMACCDGEKCGKDCQKGCSSAKQGEKKASNCCGGGRCTEHAAGHSPEAGK